MQIIHISVLKEQVPAMFSPSRVNFVLKCPLRGLYDHAGNQAYRNTGSADYAILGNIVHNVFKASSKQKPEAPVDFDAVWEKYEREEGVVNLKATLRNYGKLKFLTRSQVAKFPISGTRRNTKGNYVIPENKIIDEELALQGQPDLVVFRASKPYEIKDYKTGKIFENDASLPEEELEFEQVKQDYKNQLYLYAHLVNIKYGSYPKYLTIVQPGGFEVRTPLNRHAITNLMLEVINCRRDLVSKLAAQLAAPSCENCCYCPFKPGCKWHQVRGDDVLKDLSGIVKNVSIHAYGNFSIHLEQGEKFFYKMPAGNMANAIINLAGKEIFITSVREEIPEKNLYTPVKNSILYIKDFETQ